MTRPRLAFVAAALMMIDAPVVAQEQSPATDASTQPSGATLRGNVLVLPEETLIAFLLSEEVTSKKARKGDLIRLTLRDDLMFDGEVVVPAGTPAVGEISNARKKGFMGEGGRLSARMLYFDLVSGPVRISGPLVAIGDDQTELATLATTATLGIAFFVTGKSAVIAEGTELSVLLDREARIPHRKNETSKVEGTPTEAVD